MADVTNNNSNTIETILMTVNDDDDNEQNTVLPVVVASNSNNHQHHHNSTNNNDDDAKETATKVIWESIDVVVDSASSKISSIPIHTATVINTTTTTTGTTTTTTSSSSSSNTNTNNHHHHHHHHPTLSATLPPSAAATTTTTKITTSEPPITAIPTTDNRRKEYGNDCQHQHHHHGPSTGSTTTTATSTEPSPFMTMMKQNKTKKKKEKNVNDFSSFYETKSIHNKTKTNQFNTVRIVRWFLQYWFYYEFIERFWFLSSSRRRCSTDRRTTFLVSIRRLIILSCFVIGIIAQCTEYVLYGFLYPERIKIIFSIAIVLLLPLVLSILLYHRQSSMNNNNNSSSSSSSSTNTGSRRKKRNTMFDTILDWFVVEQNNQLYHSMMILRSSMVLYLFIVPTIIEMRTIQWLTNLTIMTCTANTTSSNCSSNSSRSLHYSILVLIGPLLVYIVLLRIDDGYVCRCHVRNDKSNQWWNRGGTTGSSSTKSIRNEILSNRFDMESRRYGWCPNYCYKQTGLYILYGFALYRILSDTSTFTQQRHLPNLISNFCFTSAILLYRCCYYESITDISSRTIRMALRCTLYDIVQPFQPETKKSTNNEYSKNNTADLTDQQLLFLTMFHWIANSWDVSSSSMASNTNSTKPTPTPRSTATQRQNDKPTTSFQSSTTETELENLLLKFPRKSSVSTSSAKFETHQPSPTNTSTSGNKASSTPQFNTFSNTDKKQCNNKNMDESVESLRAMLATMDLDERAKPAVLAYKAAVQNFPPWHTVAAMLGLFRRCPILLLCLLRMVGCIRGWYSDSFASFGLLLPFVYMDMVRIHLWVFSCHESSSSHQKTMLSTWRYWTMDYIEPMTLLLMDESYLSTRQLPALLLVWHNVKSSVGVVELSLTVTRCVQTTTVANDLVSNLLLLANFGYEIIQHGWIHGIKIVATELIHLHSTGTDPYTLWHGAASPVGASYTSATISLVRNADIIRRNINILSDDERENIGKVIGPILGFIALIIGQGWLWGRQNSDHRIHTSDEKRKSTIDIIELTDEQDIDDTSTKAPTFGTTYETTEPLDPCDVSLDCNTRTTTTTATGETISQLQRNTAGDAIKNDASSGEPMTKPVFTVDIMKEDSIEQTVDRSNDKEREMTLGRVCVDSKCITSNMPNDRGDRDATKDLPHIDSKCHETSKGDTMENLTIVSIDDISEMMDLISQCDEFGLLDTSARSIILVKLADFKGDGNNPYGEWFGTIQSNLRNLLDSREVMQNNLRHLLGSEVLVEDSCVISSTIDNAISNDVDTAAIEPSISSDDLNNSLAESKVADSIECLELDTDNGRGALSVSSEEGEETALDVVDTEKNESDCVKLALRWHEMDDDDEFEPMENVSTVANLAEVASKFPNENAIDKCIDEEEENIWLKVGSGIAILGGIVGGVVMMNAAKNRNQDQNKGR